MANEESIRGYVQRYLDEVPAFTQDRDKAIHAGCAVHDYVSVNVKDAGGHPTASLTRNYAHPRENWRPLRSSFDILFVRGHWKVRCSSGLPGGGLD